MGKTAAELYDLACRILVAEGGVRPDLAELAQATGRACHKLDRRLRPLIGSYATRLLVERSLGRATDSYPFLRGVVVESGDGLSGLTESVGREKPDKVREGLTRVVADFVGLLGEFIGEDLALHLVISVWPEIAGSK